MRVNLDLSPIQATDTIIVANNRQALAIKRSLGNASKMPKVFSYQSWLERFWRSNNLNQDNRFLTQLEFRFLLKEFIKDASVKNPETFIEELIKCYKLCKSYQIEIDKISFLPSIPTKLFVELIGKYEKFKINNQCIDQTDIFHSCLKPLQQTNNEIENFYIYGFNEPTPEQNKLFKILECKPLFTQRTHNSSQNFSFVDQESELKAIAKWAKKISEKNPSKQIGVVIPNLNELQHLVKSTFDQEFSSSLIETHKKPYNMSLGISLSDYPLIKHLISIMRLSNQFLNGYVESELLRQVVTSPYVKDASNERNNRALLVNKILRLAETEIKANKIIHLCNDCPTLKEILIALSKAKFQKKLSLENSLDLINSILVDWGFTSDRNLSSSEYQIYEKYQTESLVLNKLSFFYRKTNLSDAIEILINHMNAVIFQPQSGPANIHILGSLEAEGLFFDFAWVSSMTSNFLPGKIKMPLFIPPKISIEYSLPGTSFKLIAKESDITLNNLKNLSNDLTFSFSKTFENRDELPTPYLKFQDYQTTTDEQIVQREMTLIEDFNAPKITEFEIKRGVKTLQDQMSCGFKGFLNRLDIQEFNESHIGISRLEQGNLVHTILEIFFNEISSSSELQKLSETDLQTLIDKHIETGLKEITQSNFKSNEKDRLKKVIKKYIDLEKTREYFQVIETESESQVDINGLKFSTRIDRMDEMKDGSKLIIDYKTGKNVKLSQLISEPLDQAQLPIYAITHEVDGVAFATVNSNDCQFKAITKNKYDLPLSSQSVNRMPEWKNQVSQWKIELTSASKQFQNGKAEVLPHANACDFCDYDLLCRVDKSGYNR